LPRNHCVEREERRAKRQAKSIEFTPVQQLLVHGSLPQRRVDGRNGEAGKPAAAAVMQPPPRALPQCLMRSASAPGGVGRKSRSTRAATAAPPWAKDRVFHAGPVLTISDWRSLDRSVREDALRCAVSKGGEPAGSDGRSEKSGDGCRLSSHQITRSRGSRRANTSPRSRLREACQATCRPVFATMQPAPQVGDPAGRSLPDQPRGRDVLSHSGRGQAAAARCSLRGAGRRLPATSGPSVSTA
jgi:hypothetical protein